VDRIYGSEPDSAAKRFALMEKFATIDGLQDDQTWGGQR